MNNQSSPAQLLFPNVPSNYCPEGSWSDVLNSFIQLYLNNGTINIPGLGQVTPQQIQTINQNILNLQNQYNALAGQYVIKTGSINSVAIGWQTFTITFATPFSASNYSIIINTICSAVPSTAVGSNSITWSFNNITTTEFTLYFYCATTDNVTSINWSAFVIP